MGGIPDLNTERAASLDSVKLLARQPSFRTLGRWMLGILALVLLVLFLPWQQNVQASGEVTALRPDERPQQAFATVGGRIVRWYVAEGAVVRAGDPIIALAEVKEAYLDPRAFERLAQQVEAKRDAVTGKRAKADALARQRVALDSAWVFARQKGDNRIAQLTASLAAAQLEDSIATVQASRAQALFAEGLRSRGELETARQRAQRASALALEVAAALATARADRAGVEADYSEKIAKVEGDRSSALAEAAEGEAEVAKLSTGRDNLEERQGLLVVRAPSDGVVVRALRAGVGEIVKDGEAIASVQPKTPALAVALNVTARDVPLMQPGDRVRLEFAGWPAVQFSGWPSVAVGTFGGRVAVIDQFAQPDGTYRVLVEADSSDEDWPRELRLGSGARGWALLRNVTVGFELWRLMNGFPPAQSAPPSAAKGAKK
ncbi:MAG: HlyD family efflux transporter periplasmic adaptor subunit [Gemmatimonadetes bacterium]|jgi:adhesin transport system membrane fusion protein|nr:HlyD family efflux transporter periplasmic adaptor subunit [Gemmatimonadota bacterium]MBP7549237.1 HlyD family efflux transporter periplasmic adaptor subunit [Gemmatimonadaceae bacterium]